MRRIMIVLAVFTLALAALPATPSAASQRSQAANLISNPGFEEGAYDPAAAPPGWHTMSWNPAPMTWDSTVAHSGSRSVKILATAMPNDASWIQPVAVQPHTFYHLSAWVKTEDVGHTAELDDVGVNLTAYSDAGSSHSAGLLGSNGWTKLDLILNSGDATAIQVWLRLGYWAGTCTGTAWFDDVELTPITWSASDPHPSWKILTLIYRSTELTYVDDAGVTHRLAGGLNDAEVAYATQSALDSGSIDIPALTSGNMVPQMTVRVIDRPLVPSPMGTAWWPGPQDTAAELDPAFDSVFVVWQPRVKDLDSGADVWIGAAAGMAYFPGAGQTYASGMALTEAEYADPARFNRNLFKHEWGHSILQYFDAAGLSPDPSVTNHVDRTSYVHCPTGEPYSASAWLDEVLAFPVPGSIYNNESGFTHDYYSGTLATPDQPARCLGITPYAWAFGGPVTNILSAPPDEDQPTHAEMAIEDIKEKVNELVDDGVLGQARARPMIRRLDSALQALWDGDSRGTVRELRAFNALVRAAMEAGRLPRAEGRPLIAAAGAVIDELQP